MSDPRPDNDDSFASHRLMILHRLRASEERIEELKRDNESKAAIIADLRSRIDVATAKAAVWGGASGLGPVLLYILARAFGLTPS